MCYRYNPSWQWEDGRIPFHARVFITIEIPFCGLLTHFYVNMYYGDGEDRILFLECDQTFGSIAMAPYLCEVGSPDSQSAQPGVRTKHPATWKRWERTNATNSISVIKCPAEHVTHVFLACDKLASCFAGADLAYSSARDSWDVPLAASCAAPLTSLPPSFPCATGSQRVPYTLVCDHRGDCLDRSDEDFCLFPPCADGSQRQCGISQQVGHAGRIKLWK